MRAIKPYPSYRESDVPWLGKVPTHWGVLPNRAVFTEVSELGHSNEQMLSVTISSGVIRQHELLEDTSKKDQSRIDKAAYKLIQPGDIAFNKMRAWQGAIGVSNYRGIISPAYIVQRPLNSINPTYMHYLFRTPTFAKEAERLSYGITSDMWSLRSEHFKLIKVCIPPPSEQAVIVLFLDHADQRIRRYIRAKEKLIALLEEQKQAIIDQAITGRIDVSTSRPYPEYKPSGVEWLGEVPAHWEIKKLGRCGKILKGNGGNKEDEVPKGVPCIRYGDLYTTHTYFIVQSRSYVSTEIADEYTALQFGDVLFAASGETIAEIGKSAVNLISSKACCGGDIILFRPTREFDARYLGYLTDCWSAASQKAVMGRGITVMHIYGTQLKNLVLAIAPVTEQNAIVQFLDASVASIGDGIVRAQREINLLHEYRTRLVADVVIGKLDVRKATAALPEIDPLALDDADGSFDADFEPDAGRADMALEVADG